MIGLLIITHYRLGHAYADVAKHFFPERDFANLRMVSAGRDACHDELIGRIQAAVAEIGRGKGVLVLTDIFGATPCNAALKTAEPQKIAVLTGLNVPMLVKALSYADQADNVSDLAEKARDAGIQGIMSFQQSVR